MLHTPQQRKKLCSECPVARSADLVGDSVSLLIIRDLLAGPRRFGQLSESLEGISSRTLTLKLKALEKCKFVRHSGLNYTLTHKGRALRPIIGALRRYGEKYL